MHQTKQFYLLLSIVFIGFVGISLPYATFGPLFLQPENYTFLAAETLEAERLFWLGIALAVYPLGIFIGSPVLGSLSDTYGRKKVLCTSLFITAISSVLSGISLYTASLPLLLISRLLTGISEGNIAIARAIAQDLSKTGGPSLHSGLGKVNAVASIAYLVGPLIGGVFSSQTLFPEASLATPFYIVASLALGVALFASICLLETRVATKRGFSYKNLLFFQPILHLLRKAHMRKILLASTCFTLAVDAFYEFFPIHLAHPLGFSPLSIAIVNSFLCLTLALGNGWLPQILMKFFSNRQVILAGSLLFALSLFLFSFQETFFGTSLLAAFCGLSLSTVVVNYSVELSKGADDDIQGEAFGVLMGLRTLSDAIICLIGTSFMLAASNAPLVAASLVACISAFYFKSRIALSPTNTVPPS